MKERAEGGWSITLQSWHESYGHFMVAESRPELPDGGVALGLAEQKHMFFEEPRREDL